MKIRFLFLSLALFLLATVCFAKDLYGVLGVERDATDAQIRKSFRKLSMKHHPDKNQGNPEAAEKFVEINEAYDILTNPDKRQVYDLDGYEALKAPSGGPNPHDPFAMFRGGGGHGGRPKGPNAVAELRVTLEQLYNGSEASLNIERNVLCSKCRGTGARDAHTHTCPVCRGRGMTVRMQTLGPGFQVQTQAPCDKCGGKGKVAAHACPVCSGHKVKKEKKSLTVHIDRGARDGDQVVFERESEQSPQTTPGDVVVVLRQTPHRVFRREGDHLHADVTVTLKEALLGFSQTLQHLDGRTVTVKADGVTKPFSVIVIKGEGMPQQHTPSIKGDLHVKIHVRFPDSINASQRDKFMQIL
jgi:DnaJ-class molecular chaperone